jgi:polyisoprenoid-binding protein YceI
MIRTFATAAVLTVALTAPALANPNTQDPAKVPAGTYELDKRHASLFAKIPHMGGFSRYTLRMTGLDGGFTYDPTNWQATKVTINVNPAGIETGDPGFNKQIAGYFDTAKFPAITFVSTDLKAEETGRGVLTGDLTFHGVTKPVALDVVFNGAGPGLLGAGTRIGFSGTGRIKRSDFGVTAARQFAGDDVDLIFEVEFVKK